MAQQVQRLKPGLAAAALIAAAACRSGEAPKASPPARASAAPASRANVLFISIDTLRADHCSAYGYPHPTTPRLERLAAEGARVVDAYAPMATTGPSHATMLTALDPASHGVVKNGYVLAPEHVTLAERLEAEGYLTAAIVSSFPLAAKFGLDQGFEHYDADFGPRRPKDPARWDGEDVPTAFDRRAEVTTGLALEWLRARTQGRPFFLWLHFFDPHGPYAPPRAFRDLARAPGTPWPTDFLLREIWRYDGEIRYADDAMGQILDALDASGLKQSTLVVVVGDHGEGLNDHGRMEHGVVIYEEAVRVPLVFRYPGRVASGLTVPGPIPLADLTPTILDFVLEHKPAAGLQGQTQRPVLEGRAGSDPERKIFLQRRYYDPESQKGLRIRGDKFAIRVGAWKYLVAEEEDTRELYNLREDPRELANVVAQHPDKARDLEAALGEWRKAHKRASRQEMSAEDVERLKALGYVQ